MSLSLDTIATTGLWSGTSFLLLAAVLLMVERQVKSDALCWWSLGSLSLGVLLLATAITAGHWRSQELLRTVPATLAQCSTERPGELPRLSGIDALSLTHSQVREVLRCARQDGDCWEKLVAAVGAECRARE